MAYTPNYHDPRVQKKIKRALGFAFAQLSDEKQRALSKKYLDKVFGQQQNELSKFLREKVMITTNDFFRFNSALGSQCKWYKRNKVGVNELMSHIDFDVERKLLTISTTNYSYCITSQDEAVKNELALEFARNDFGKMLETGNIEYADKAGRLWGGTQGLKKHIKRQIHAEYGYCYEYDIEAAAPTLLYQLAQRYGCKKLEEIEFYLEQKEQIRMVLSQHLDIPLEDIKEVINALFAGARVDQSIKDIIKNPQKLNKLKSNVFINNLKKDITYMWKAIKPSIGERYNKKTMEREKKISSATKWYVYFGLERQVLDVVVKFFSGKCSRYVLEHDGWTTSVRLNLDDLEEEIKNKTGFVIKIKEQVLSNTQLVACV